MRLLDTTNAEAYLRETGRLAPSARVRICELTGGVSNMVLFVEHLDTPSASFVLKQARPQLRTKQVWLSNVERIWREADVLRAYQDMLSPAQRSGELTAATPRILFEDRAEYLFGMTAAPVPHVTWKSKLLAGTVEPRVASAVGAILGTMHAASWCDAELADRFGNQTLFDELRLAPYYRTLASQRADARNGVKRLLTTLKESPRALVHADFSPKNILIYSGGLMLVDFETGHYGDPAFDLGFFLSHLLLKATYWAPEYSPFLQLMEQFRSAYNERLGARISSEELSNLWTRGVQNLAGCAWARLDGKSPVEYLTDQQKFEAVRDLSRELFEISPTDWQTVLSMVTSKLSALKQ